MVNSDEETLAEFIQDIELKAPTPPRKYPQYILYRGRG